MPLSCQPGTYMECPLLCQWFAQAGTWSCHKPVCANQHCPIFILPNKQELTKIQVAACRSQQSANKYLLFSQPRINLERDYNYMVSKLLLALFIFSFFSRDLCHDYLYYLSWESNQGSNYSRLSQLKGAKGQIRE